jgi:uncharacterized membrane protein
VTYLFSWINDNISCMNHGRVIALAAGAVVTVLVLGAGLALLYFGGIVPENDRLIVTSIALAPLAMVAVMIGYGVWWGVVFLFALFNSAGDAERTDRDLHSDLESPR